MDRAPQRCHEREYGIVADLIAAGVDANARETFHGTTPLHWAAASGNREVVKLLLAHGANPNVKETFTGAMPLIWAAASGRSSISVIKILVDHGADRNAVDVNGHSALDWASRHRTSRELVFLGQKDTSRKGKPMIDSNSEHNAGQSVVYSVLASLTLLQQSSEVFLDKTKRGCISCHHQDLPMMAVGLAEEVGVNVDRQIAQHQVDAMLEILGKRSERLLEGTGIPDASMPVMTLWACMQDMFFATIRRMHLSTIWHSSSAPMAIGLLPSLGLP